MLCPYCLENTPKKENCAYCKEDLPPQYIRLYRGRRPPVIISATGFSGHGKTVYLAALLHLLTNSLTLTWPGFYRQGLDQDSINTVKNNLRMLQKGDLPESTRRNFPRPSLHLLAKMPKYKDRQIIIYDPPGEAFEEDQSMEKFASFVTQARTALFLVSLVDLEEPIYSDLHRLLEVYALGMARMNAVTRKQRLVVVYTKSDLLLGDQYLGGYLELIDYLQSSDREEIRNVKNYVRRMDRISAELADFTSNCLGAQGFINLARENFKSVSYCAVSALGSPPEGDKLCEAMNPRRVLDPLLWVLERQ